MGRVRAPDFYPSLLLKALESDDARIVAEALEWSVSCHDDARRQQLHARLRNILANQNDALKLQACYSLVYSFKDAVAMSYAIKQLQSTNQQRVLEGLAVIGDDINFNDPLPPNLLHGLRPLLKSDDVQVRRSAVRAMGSTRATKSLLSYCRF